ncbi:hypothetical protein PI125_g5882 [Phytophthora idaei]|nr:hypothetical protein PI125_g5882 [Phytophthora idaei]
MLAALGKSFFRLKDQFPTSTQVRSAAGARPHLGISQNREGDERRCAGQHTSSRGLHSSLGLRTLPARAASPFPPAQFWCYPP